MNIKLYLVTDSSGRLKTLGDALLTSLFHDGSVVNVVEYPNHAECKSFAIAVDTENLAIRLKVNSDVYLRRIPTTFNKKNILGKEMIDAVNLYVRSYPDCDVVFIPKEERLKMEDEGKRYIEQKKTEGQKSGKVSNNTEKDEIVNPPALKKVGYKKPAVINPPTPEVQVPDSQPLHIPYTPLQDVKRERLNPYFVEALRYMAKYRYDLKEKDEEVFWLIANMIFNDKSKNIESVDYIETIELKATCDLEAAKIIKSVIKCDN